MGAGLRYSVFESKSKSKSKSKPEVRHPITPLLHYSTTPLLHYSITPRGLQAARECGQQLRGGEQVRHRQLFPVRMRPLLGRADEHPVHRETAALDPAAVGGALAFDFDLERQPA